MCATWADYTGGVKVKTKPERTLVVLHKRRTTDGKIAGSKCFIVITEKTHECNEARRHAVMLEIPERVYEECQVKLKRLQ